MVDFQRPEGREFDGYLSVRDDPTGPPAVLVFQAWWGLIGQIRGVADRLVASAGSFALVPDLFRGKTTIEEEANHLMNRLDFAEVTSQDVAGALQYLGTKSDRTASMGYCMGRALTPLAPVPPPYAVSVCRLVWLSAARVY
ncbi:MULTISPECIES: dienelactone hydrolase family protein [Paraburkholderia]|uniref:dienelactone hydrolase family protein n=1 Tax=Paraburkholderia TaxID=1822464 RepID=UPI0038B92C02